VKSRKVVKANLILFSFRAILSNAPKTRAPTWGSAVPPSHGLKQSQAFQDGIIS